MSRKSTWTVIFVAAAAGLGLWLSRGPWQAYLSQKASADAATKEMVKSEADMRDLMQQKARMDSPMGRESAARERGYRLKNEQPLETGQ